ncbi:hypothetical protein RHGRI_006944 [Rhododendron griersonianum]|uniref:No apical meristem-associated C-terminal domain-containing protein n=1 Tax=Rhododendron griersonianum TaxID=479676 RepID=A0AAV6KXJ0_9ERIC|nr:hypothetical protein RHGRI_006944 [Rhododendron griersonianum]
MEEEDSFRTVISKIRALEYVVNSDPEEEDDEVDNEDGDKNASKEKEDNPVDDMEKHRVENLDDRAKNNEKEAEKLKEHDFNGRQQSELEKEPVHLKQAVQGDMPIGIPNTVENSIEESSNSAHGLVSFVQDSQSPINEECLDYANCKRQDKNAEIRLDDKHEHGEDSETAANFQMQCDSNISIRASQVDGINLLVDLIPSALDEAKQQYGEIVGPLQAKPMQFCKFKFEHYWKLLKDSPKWNDNVLVQNTSKGCKKPSNPQSQAIDLDDLGTPSTLCSIPLDEFKSMDHEHNEKEKLEAKKKSEEEKWEAKKRRAEQKTLHEEMKVMRQSMVGLTPEQAAYWKLQQSLIVERYKANGFLTDLETYEKNYDFNF